MNEFDRLIAESLEHRAGAVPALPKSYGDVSRRIVRRRRRGASMATAAVTLPAIAAVGWAAMRPDPLPTAVGSPNGGDGDPFQTTSTALGGAQYRCTGEAGSDGQWTYYQYCEPAVVPTTTTELVNFPTATTAVAITNISESIDHVVFVDASGGLDFRSDLVRQLGVSPRYELPATRIVEHTMVMPTGADVEIAYGVLQWLNIAALDTWTPDLIGASLPADISVVVVVGADWFDPQRGGGANCVPATTVAPFIDTTTTTLLDGGVPVTTLPPQFATTTTAPC